MDENHVNEHVNDNPHDHEAIGELPKAPEVRPGRITAIAVVALTVLVVGFFAGFVPRVRRLSALENEALQVAERKAPVQVTKPKVRPPTNELMLPGSVQPLQETTIYARTSGYLKEYAVDLGDSVRAGQLLCEIDTPEVDAQLRGAEAAMGEAKAALEQAKTQLELARVNLQRAELLSPKGYTSQQERDEKTASFHVAEANLQMAQAKVGTQEAEVTRLRQLKGFARVTAPFNGTITSRGTEVGSLVNAGGTGQALFKLAKSDVVRVFINVPQSVAASVTEGEKTVVTVRELPGKTFAGTVSRIARALDDTSRTMLAEIHIPNYDHVLLPGMFVEVRFAVSHTDAQLSVPANALVFGSAGPQLAVVDGSAHVHLKSVQLGEDYGNEVAVLSGLDANDDVILNPGDKAVDGIEVKVLAPKKGS